MLRLRSCLALVLSSLVLLSACGGDDAPAEDGVVRVEVGASGYEPGEIQATAGQPLTIEFTRVTDEGCGQELVIASQDIRRNLPLDEAVRVTFTPEESGRLRFTCGMDMYDGVIVVQ
ncbi:MAG: cupredoxin domain-containing protein [Sandaracinaceae bacterium]